MIDLATAVAAVVAAACFAAGWAVSANTRAEDIERQVAAEREATLTRRRRCPQCGARGARR